MNASESSSQPSHPPPSSHSTSSQWILCHRWPLPPNAPPFVIVPTTNLYRKFASRTIPTQPHSVVVVEIGCCNGFCTQKIVNRVHSPADQVLGMDIGPQFIRECQDKFPHVQFECINVLMEWNRTKALIEDKIKHVQLRSDEIPDLHLYVDIGGNREIETLLALLQTIQTQLKPPSLIVKSKALFAFGQKHDLTKMGAWEDLQSMAQEALLQRRTKEHLPESQEQQQQDDNKDATRTIGKTQQAAIQKRLYHPLKMPQRYDADGIAICRFHNFDRKNGCLLFRDTNRHGKTCPLDHEHCHTCLELDHVAWQCPHRCSTSIKDCQSPASLVDGLAA